MPTIQQLAQTAYDAMKRGKRDNGEVYYKFSDDAPDWCADLARAAHGDMLPDDFRYAAMNTFLSNIADMPRDATRYDIGEQSDEWIDNAVDIWNHRLAAWLGSHLSRGGHVNEGVEMFGVTDDDGFDIWRCLRIGQYQELCEIYEAVVSFLDDMAEDDD